MNAMNGRTGFACVSRVLTQSAKALAVACVLLQASAIAAAPDTEVPQTVSVSSIPDAMDTLVKRYGYVVTLETPRYVYEGDLEEEPPQLPGDTHAISRGPGPRILRSRGIELTLNLPPATSVGTVEMSSVVKQLAQNVSTSDHGAHYRVEQEGDVFHIIPFEVRDAKGNWAAHAPLFDTLISMPPKERTLLEAVNAVCSALRTESHQSVQLLQAPITTLVNSTSAFGANKESARTALTRVLGSTDGKLTWRVFYDIPMNSYLLSVFVVPERPSGAAGMTATQSAPTATAPAGTAVTGGLSPADAPPKH